MKFYVLLLLVLAEIIAVQSQTETTIAVVNITTTVPATTSTTPTTTTTISTTTTTPTTTTTTTTPTTTTTTPTTTPTTTTTTPTTTPTTITTTPTTPTTTPTTTTTTPTTTTATPTTTTTTPTTTTPTTTTTTSTTTTTAPTTVSTTPATPSTTPTTPTTTPVATTTAAATITVTTTAAAATTTVTTTAAAATTAVTTTRVTTVTASEKTTASSQGTTPANTGTSSSQSSSAAVSTQTSEAPATTTIVPTTPEPSRQQNFTCKNGTTTKFSLVGSFSLIITYNKTEEGPTTVTIDVPQTNSTEGTCDNPSTESLTFNFFTNWSITYIFTESASSESNLLADPEYYYISNITVAFVHDEHLPNSTNSGAREELTFAKNNYLEAKGDGYYTCESSLSQKITDDVTLITTDFKYKAFNPEGDISFDTGTVAECPSDEETSSVVPIAVGAALAGLVIIVLIAYLIGRRRSRKTGYETV